MQSLTTDFNRTANIHSDWIFWILVWMLIIDDDRQGSEKERKRKQEAHTRSQRVRRVKLEFRP